MMQAVSRRQAGVAMMESLFAMAVLMVGLLGIVGLQAKTQTSYFEAYQRAQALLLLDDMVNRINANRSAAVETRQMTSPSARARKISRTVLPVRVHPLRGGIDDAAHRPAVLFQSLSMMVALAMPPPSHMV